MNRDRSMLLNKNEKDKGWWVGWNIDKDKISR